MAFRHRACVRACHFVTPFIQKKRAEIEKNVAAARAKHAEFQMHAVEREAAQLVRQFRTAPPQHQARLALALVEFCCRQPQERQWQDAGGRAGVVSVLVQALNLCDAALQQAAFMALGCLVDKHHDNQSTAAAAGAIPHLMQLSKSSNAAIQKAAVAVLGGLLNHHFDNQSAAAAADWLSK